ncbi:MAG: hypothetical protein U0841_09100 [Chloroflexia bacterium]
MIALLTASWGVLLKRLRADWLLLAATGLTILLATTLLAAGPLYTESVTLAGLRHTLHDAPVNESNFALAVSLLARNYPATDRAVTARVTEAFGPAGGTIARSGRSESFAYPGQPANDIRDLAVFAFFEGIAQHATLVSGAWPAGTSEPYQIAMPESVAQERGYRLGDEFQIESRLTPTFRPKVRVTGLYRVNDPADPYWYGDPLDTTGREIGQSFNTFGPFVVTQEAFLGPLNQNSARVTWRAYPNIERLTANDLAPLREQVATLLGRLGIATPNATFQIDTRLPEQLAVAERSLLVTRSGVLIQLIQLAILAGYALVLTAGLLVEQRRGEAALLHARGVGPSQAFVLAALEGDAGRPRRADRALVRAAWACASSAWPGHWRRWGRCRRRRWGGHRICWRGRGARLRGAAGAARARRGAAGAAARRARAAVGARGGAAGGVDLALLVLGGGGLLAIAPLRLAADPHDPAAGADPLLAVAPGWGCWPGR